MTSECILQYQKVRQEVRCDVKKYAITSTNTSLCQTYITLESSSWRQTTCQKNMSNYLKVLYAMTSKCTKITPWCQNVCHDVKNFVIMSKSMESILWHQKVHHDVKKFVMTSKTRHDVKTFVMTAKSYFGTNYVFFLTNLVWPIPVIFLDNSGIIPGYLHVAFCNNRPTFNEVMVSYRAAGGQTGTHTSPHLISSHAPLHPLLSTPTLRSAPLLSTPPLSSLPLHHSPTPHFPTSPLPLHIARLCTT